MKWNARRNGGMEVTRRGSRGQEIYWGQLDFEHYFNTTRWLHSSDGKGRGRCGLTL